MISAIQYTLVERLVSVLITSIRTPSSMSPQHFPIGAWNTHDFKYDSAASGKSQPKLATVYLHVWNSWLALHPCYCYRYTDPSQSSLQGSLSHTNIKHSKLQCTETNSNLTLWTTSPCWRTSFWFRLALLTCLVLGIGSQFCHKRLFLQDLCLFCWWFSLGNFFLEIL